MNQAAQRRMDATELLSREQLALRGHFRDFQRVVLRRDGLEQKAVLAGRICDACCLHLQLKEELVHPAARSVLHGDPLLNDVHIQHARCLALIAQLDELEPQDRDFDATITVLAAHLPPLFDEEQRTLFPRLCHSVLHLQSLGQQLVARRRQLQADVTQRAAQAAGA
jgi:hypothetical protein